VGYCEGCGKKLPPASLAHKRREPILHDRAGVAAPDPERALAPPASAWLFTAAIVNLLGCGGLVVLGPLLVPREQLKADFIPDLLGVSVAVLLAFATLGWWGRRQPMTAALVAAAVYVGLASIEMVLVPGLALLGIPVKIAILALLIQAIRISRRPRRFAAEL
jgi:hypothetical protein